jgi:hypothetical protein
MTAYAGRFIKIRVRDTSVTAQYFTSDTFLANGSDITFYLAIQNSAPQFAAYDSFSGGRSTIYSGSLTGQTRNTAIPSPLWIASTPTYTTNSHAVTFQTEASSNGSSWDSPVTWTPGSAPAPASKQYIRWSVTLSTGGTTNGTALPFVETVPLAARASTGTYQGAHFETPVSSFGSFEAIETLNSGQTAYAIYTDTNTSASFSNSSTWVSSQTITSGAVPTLTPNTYAFFLASATITAGSQDPTISELSLALSGGNQSPVWSEYHLGTYMTALSTASASGNDSVLLYDRNQSWTMYDHDWYCMRRIISGSILGGHNSDGKIYRFRDRTLESDNGSAINWYWRSKDFDFGLPVTDKTMLRYYVTADYKAGADITFTYGVNRGAGTTASLDLDLLPGFFRKSIVPSSLTYQKGIQHYFRLSDAALNESCVIRTVSPKPRAETEP